ncbi:MAG: hypothetical protein AAGI52_15730 [Bacteroidota bacterium]
MPILGLLFATLIVVLALVFSVIGAIWLWRAGRWGRVGLGALAVLLGWIVKESVSPGEAYYRALFERETGRSFPASAQIVRRQAALFPEEAASLVAEIDSVDATRLNAAVAQERQRSGKPEISCGGSTARAGYRGVRTDHKDGRCLWWGVSEDGRRFAFEYLDL